MNVKQRELIQKAYIRVCRDSRFRMEMCDAAQFAARLVEVTALDVLIALGFDNMERIAAGTHECLENLRYDT